VLAELVEQGGEGREFAANAGGREPALLEVVTPGDDVGNGAQLGDAAEAGEGDELLNVDLVGAAGFGVGEPFELRRDLGESGELGRYERTLISYYAGRMALDSGARPLAARTNPTLGTGQQSKAETRASCVP
jgi:hypothetical protein